MLKILISYWLLSVIIMIVNLFTDNTYFEQCDKDTIETNKKLKEKLLQKKISPFVYKDSLLDLKKERRSCIIAFCFLAPVIAPKFLLSMILDIIYFIRIISL